MATSTLNGPVSFTQYFQRINQPRVLRYWLAFIKADSVFTRLPMHTEGALVKRGKRVIDKLPNIEFHAIGQEPTNSFTTSSVDFEESLALIRGNNDIDKALLSDKNYIEADPTKIDIKLYMEARAMALNNYFFNNQHFSGPIDDPNGFIGIKYRLRDTNGLNGTSKYGCNPACVFQATADLSDNGLSGAGAIKITRDMDRMFHHMGAKDGTGITIFCSPQLGWQLDAIIKTAGTAGGFKITEDAFNRSVIKYKNATICSCGLLPPQDGGLQTAPIIDSSQDANGWSTGDPLFAGNGNYSSMYFVNSGEEGFYAWQQEDPWMVKERITGTRTVRIMLDQTAGIFMQNTRALGVLYGIKCNGATGD